MNELLTITKAAEVLGVHAATLRRWADAGTVPMVKLPSGYRRFERDAMQKLREDWQSKPVVSDKVAAS